MKEKTRKGFGNIPKIIMNDMVKVKVVCLKRYIKEVEFEDLTEKEVKLIKRIEVYKYKKGKVPTLRTICKMSDYKGVASAHDLMNKLKLKGYDYRKVDYSEKSL